MPLQKKNAIKAHYDELASEVSEKQGEINEIINYFNNIIPEYDDIAKYEEMASLINQYNHNINQNTLTVEDREEYNNLQMLFQDGVPSDGELDNCEESIVNIMKYDSNIQAYSLTAEENNEFQRLDAVYQGSMDLNEQLNVMSGKYNKLIELAGEIEKEKGKLTALENLYDSNSEMALKISSVLRYQLYLFLFGMAFFIIAIVVAVKFEITRVSTTFIGIGLALCSISYVWKVRNDKKSYENESICDKNYEDILSTKKTIENYISERRKIAEELTKFSTKYAGKDNLKDMVSIISDISLSYKNYLFLKNKKMTNDEELWVINKKRDSEVAFINSVLSKYYQFFDCTNNISLQEKKWRDIIKTIRSKKKDFLMLQNKISEYEKNYHELSLLEPEFSAFVNQYFVPENNLSPDKKIQALKSTLDSYHRLRKELELSINKLNNFKIKNESVLESIEDNDVLSLEELHDQRRKIVEAINFNREEYDNIKIKCSEFGEVVSRKPEFETEVDRITEELTEAKYKHELLSSTKAYLEESKKQFSSRYLTNLNKSFNKYISMLNGSTMQNAQMDTSLNINFEAYGSKKDFDYMSTGYKDLLSFCTRLALVDAMFVDEHPVLILDDPFVNLDKEKIENALELIREVSTEYQIIYFVCHSSRV